MPAYDSLADLFAEFGIRVPNYRPGMDQKVTCPRCDGGRTKEKSLSVKVDADGFGATWTCKRVKGCGWSGGGKVKTEDGYSRPKEKPREYRTPPPVPEDQQGKNASLYGYFAARGISEETVDKFGCYVSRKWFPNGGEQPAITFPYVWNGKVVNRKYRSKDKQMQQEKDPLPTLYNIDAIDQTDPGTVVWVEGEPDCMAIDQSGYPQVVTLKDGAPGELRDEDDPRREDDKRFHALNTHADLLAKVQRFILAGDMDGPGEILREELARRLGRHRCWNVTWPDDCKDANDTLLKHGPERVQECIEKAEPWPIEGIQTITPDSLVLHRKGKPPPLLTTGTGASDEVLRLPGEGRLIVVTGIPNMGKSSWMVHIKSHLMQRHDRRWLVFSPEMLPWKDYVAQVAQHLAGKPYWPQGKRAGTPVEIMDDDEVRKCEAFLASRLFMLGGDSEDEPPTPEWVLAKAKEAVLRYGITDLEIDPWNQLEHHAGNMNESHYIARCLQKFKAFGLRHGCNVWIVAHPNKPMAERNASKTSRPPTMYDISGGANWNNATDLGLVIHRDRPGALTRLILAKPRFKRWGERESEALLEFNTQTGRYSTPLGAAMEAHEALKEDDLSDIET